LSQPDPAPAGEPLAALPRLPRDKGGPVFAEPWEAQAFALALKLSEQGHLINDVHDDVSQVFRVDTGRGSCRLSDSWELVRLRLGPNGLLLLFNGCTNSAGSKVAMS
jgi:hypothetical protein